MNKIFEVYEDMGGSSWIVKADSPVRACRMVFEKEASLKSEDDFESLDATMICDCSDEEYCSDSMYIGG